MHTPSITPATTGYLIMLALAAGPNSGSEIQRQIIADAVGEYVSNGTLYENLRRLEAGGLIEHVSTHGRERVMALTSRGRKRLEQETKLLQMIAQTARSRVL